MEPSSALMKIVLKYTDYEAHRTTNERARIMAKKKKKEKKSSKTVSPIMKLALDNSFSVGCTILNWAGNNIGIATIGIGKDDKDDLSLLKECYAVVVGNIGVVTDLNGVERVTETKFDDGDMIDYAKVTEGQTVGILLEDIQFTGTALGMFIDKDSGTPALYIRLSDGTIIGFDANHINVYDLSKAEE